MTDGYDASQNPRSLRQEPMKEEWVEQLAEREAYYANLAHGYDAQIAMFKSRGWELTAGWLQMELQKAVNALADPEYPVENVPVLRGQIIAYQFLMTLPETLKLMQQATREELKRIHQQQEDDAVLRGKIAPT